ncbi:MAG: hypothetical protein KIS62_01245 [Ramlibacter sp.]|nr:hypothetical protein [Ramlibacter sp.]
MTTKAKIVFEGDDKTKGAVDSVKKGFDGIQNRAEAVGNFMGTTFGLAVSGGLLATANALRSGIDELERMDKASQKVGITAQKLAEYSYNAKLSGANAELLEKGVANLSKKMSENDKIFVAMGINVKKANGELKATDVVLEELADKFASYADGPEKVAIAQELMGKSGRELIPMLNQGAEGLRKMGEEARALGLVFGPDQIRQAADYKDNIDRLSTAMDGAGIAMAERMLPGLIQVTDQMVQGAKQGGMMLGIWKGLAEFASIAFNTDKLGQAISKTSQLNSELARVGDQVTQQIAIVNSDPENSGAQRRLNLLRSKLTALQKEALAASEAVKQALDPGYGVDPSYASLEARRLAKHTGKVAAPQISSTTTAAAVKSEYESLRTEMLKRAQLVDEELAQGAKLSEGRKFELDMLAKLESNYGRLTLAQIVELEAQAHSIKVNMEAIDQRKLLAERQKEERKIVEDLFKSREKLFDTEQQHHDAAKTLVKDAEFELEMLGKTNSERQVAIALRQLEATGVQKGTLAYEAYAEALGKSVLDRAAMQKQIDDFGRLWESVDSTARDTFRGIGDDWEGTVQRMKDTVKNVLLDWMYQSFARPLLFNVVASGSGANQTAINAVAGTNGLGNLSSLGSLGNLAGSLGFGGGSSVFTQFATSGMGNALGLSTTVDAIGGVGTASSSMTGLGSALSTAAPYLAAAVAVASLFGGKKGGPKEIGSYGAGSLSDLYARGDTNASSNSSVKSIVDGIAAGYATATKAFGIKGGSIESGALVAVDPKGDAKTALATTSYLNGKLVYDRNDSLSGSDAYKDVGRSTEELQAAITEASARAVLSALKASDLPAKVAEYFSTLDPLQLSAEQIQSAMDAATQANALWKAMDELGPGFANIGALSVELTGQLAEAAGGWDALANGVSTFYQTYYTEQERADLSLQAVTKTMTELGYANVDTMAGLRSLIEGLDLTTQEGRSLYASLIKVSPAFAAVHSSIDAVSSKLATMGAAATAFFAGLDGQNMAASLSSEASAGIDKFIGSTVQTVADAQATQAQAALNAAREAATLWGQAQNSIEAALADVRGITASLQAPSVRRSTSLATLDKATLAALAGDATSAASVGALAQQFLNASESSSVDRISYLRDRALAEAKLASVLDKTKAQVTLQEAIVTASESTVAQLQVINQTLTGFSAQVFELLSKGYQGADRDTATAAADKLAKATSDFAYWFNTTKEGDTVTGGQWGTAKWTRLAGDMASFTDSSGGVTYLRAADTILEAAKRDPELRRIWEQQYGIKLPAFAGGGDHEGGWATVGEAGAERVFMPRARIFSANDTMAMDGAQASTVSELRGLRGDLAQARTETRRIAVELIGRSQAIDGRLKKWDNTGMPPVRVGDSA